MAWTVLEPQREKFRNASALAALEPLLVRLVGAFGATATARLLGVKSGTITNWTKGRRSMDPEYAKRVINLHDVLTRALQIFPPETALKWLGGNEPFLNDQRPIDALALGEVGAVVAALEGIDAEAYA